MDELALRAENLPEAIEIRPCGPIRGQVRPPGSKSITNRALICAALAEGCSELRGILDSEDTRVMAQALAQLGFQIEVDWENAWAKVGGSGGIIPADSADMFVANSGTSMRFLTALVALGRGRYRLDGIARMRERPIGDLLIALNQLGVNARSERENGCPPVVVESQGLNGGKAQIAGNISSQFLSGLLMALPCAEGDTEIVVTGQLVSKPYVEMTLAVVSQFGCHIEQENLQRFYVPGKQRYKSRAYEVEPDASAASYFWAAAAITGGRVTVCGLNAESLQGDVEFCRCLQQMGCSVEFQDDRITVEGGQLHGVDVDMNAISDTVQTLAAVALFAKGSTIIRGVGHIRHKETDRIAALATELRKLGARVQETGDGLVIRPGEIRPAEIDTYNDHRMAMSMSLVGLRVPGVVIRNPACVAKTYPGFFVDLQRLVGQPVCNW